MEHPEQIRAMRSQAASADADGGAESFEANWMALHNHAREIGKFAALAEEPFREELAGFPARIRDAGAAQQELAQRGLEDITAMLQPGLAALRAISGRGQEPTAPALALWREFHAARQALLLLCPQ